MKKWIIPKTDTPPPVSSLSRLTPLADDAKDMKDLMSVAGKKPGKKKGGIAWKVARVRGAMIVLHGKRYNCRLD